MLYLYRGMSCYICTEGSGVTFEQGNVVLICTGGCGVTFVLGKVVL